MYRPTQKTLRYGFSSIDAARSPAVYKVDILPTCAPVGSMWLKFQLRNA
ncbi:MAG: hypothetical protein ACTHLL_03125 [Candidatus Nitrosocosmicus sp.]